MAALFLFHALKAEMQVNQANAGCKVDCRKEDDEISKKVPAVHGNFIDGKVDKNRSKDKVDDPRR